MMINSVPPQGQPYKFFGRQYSGPENQSNLLQIQTPNIRPPIQRPANPYHVNYNIYKQVHHAPNTSAPVPSSLPGTDHGPPRYSYNNEMQHGHRDGNDHTNQDIEARKIRRNLMRRTVDYNASILQTIKNRIWRKTPGMYTTVQPDVLYYNDIVQPRATMENPINCVTTRFVRTSTNKIRTPLFSVAWTPEGRRLVTGASSGEFTLWNGLTFNFETILQAHDSAVRAMEWSHNSTWLLSGDHHGIIKYWQSNMNNVKLFQAHLDPIRGLSFSPTDNKFATCGDDSLVKIWDFHRCYEEKVLRGHGADVKCVDWHPTKGLLVSGSKDSQQPLKLWDPRNGTSLATIHLHKSTVMDIEWNENGNWLLTGSRDHLVKVFDIRAMKEIKTFRGHRKEATAVSWHPIHENLFVSAGSDGCLKFWTLECEKELGAVNNAHEGMIWTAKWHPLGHVLVTGSNDHTSKFWTRNRPGDKMRDKYNLNTLPFGMEDDYDLDIAEAPETPRIQAAPVDASLPGLDAKVVTSNEVDTNETDTSGIPGFGKSEGNKMFQSPSKALASIQGAIKQSGFKLPGITGGDQQDSSLRPDAPAFEPSADADEDFYINIAREIEEEENMDDDGIPLDLQIIGEDGKPKPKGRGDTRKRKQQKNTGKGLLPTPGEESKPKSLMDGDIEPPPCFSEADDELLGQSETQDEWRGNSEYNNRPPRKNANSRRGDDGMNGQRPNRRAFPRNNKRPDDRHSANDGQRHDNDGLEDQWHNNRQMPPRDDRMAFHGPEGHRMQDDTFGPPFAGRGPNRQQDDNNLQQGGRPWPNEQGGGPDLFNEGENEPPPPPPPPQSFDGGMGHHGDDFTDDDCWGNNNLSSRNGRGRGRGMGRGRGRGENPNQHPGVDHGYRDDRDFQSGRGNRSPQRGRRNERADGPAWRNRRDRMPNEQRDPGVNHEPNPDSGPPDWPPPPPPEWNEDEPPPKRMLDAERRPNQGRDFPQGIDNRDRDNRGGRGGRGRQRGRPQT